jgi:hypothetical protein
MNLIDRYLNEVGRYLPRTSRSDILAELRSVLIDTLEGRIEGEASEEDVVALLQEFGPPQKVAASYTGQGQYLIGPALYPLFRMITLIVLAAVIGAQLLAFGLGVFWLGDQVLNPWESLAGLLTSIPAALGSVVIVFAILQRLDVRPKLDEEDWDPRTLPEIVNQEPVKRGERIFGIAAASVLLAVLVFFPDKVGMVMFPGGQFFSDPVILQYQGWIILALLAGIGMDIYLLWQGSWNTASQIARLAVSLLTIAVLALLLQGHNAWLAERGVTSALTSITQFASNVDDNWQLFGMQAFRMAFGVALIVTVIETVLRVYRLVRAAFGGKATRVTLSIH